MHPDQRCRDNHEQQHEAACPDTGQVIQQPEDDREDETAEPAHEADKSAHRADILGVIDRYVLVDRRFAEAHEKAKHKDRDDEHGRACRQPEADRSADTVHHVRCWRIGEEERDNNGHKKSPVHHRPCTDFV